MPAFIKNKLLLSLLLVPFFTSLIVGLISIPILGASAFIILTIGAAIILSPDKIPEAVDKQIDYGYQDLMTKEEGMVIESFRELTERLARLSM
jgi:hypothetical protein